MELDIRNIIPLLPRTPIEIIGEFIHADKYDRDEICDKFDEKTKNLVTNIIFSESYPEMDKTNIGAWFAYIKTVLDYLDEDVKKIEKNIMIQERLLKHIDNFHAVNYMDVIDNLLDIFVDFLYLVSNESVRDFNGSFDVNADINPLIDYSQKVIGSMSTVFDCQSDEDLNTFIKKTGVLSAACAISGFFLPFPLSIASSALSLHMTRKNSNEYDKSMEFNKIFCDYMIDLFSYGIAFSALISCIRMEYDRIDEIYGN